MTPRSAWLCLEKEWYINDWTAKVGQKISRWSFQDPFSCRMWIYFPLCSEFYKSRNKRRRRSRENYWMIRRRNTKTRTKDEENRREKYERQTTQKTWYEHRHKMVDTYTETNRNDKEESDLRKKTFVQPHLCKWTSAFSTCSGRKGSTVFSV